MAATDPNKPTHPAPHLGDETMPGHMDGLVDTTGRGPRRSRYALEPGARAPTMLGGLLGRHLARIGSATHVPFRAVFADGSTYTNAERLSAPPALTITFRTTRAELSVIEAIPV